MKEISKYMNRVEPIKNINNIYMLKNYLLKSGNIRNYTLVVIGLNSVLKISQIIKLKWSDVYNFSSEEFKNIIYENKNRKININTGIKEALQKFFDSNPEIQPEDYIFKSREGENKPITRYTAIKLIKKACSQIGIKENIGCDSLRKTYGYQSYIHGTPIPILMAEYNHTTQKETIEYLGIEENLNIQYNKFVV